MSKADLAELERIANGRKGRDRGNRRENAVASILRTEGWIVGSMRQSFGAGDLIAAKLAGTAQRVPISRFAMVWLVEVKSTAGGPYERFGPMAREEMLLAAERAGATAWIAYWPPRAELRWIPSHEWPA